MNDPQTIRYVNEVVRPIAERLRDLRDDLTNALATWHASGIGTAMSVDLNDTVVDPVRSSTGVGDLKCNDAVGLMNLAERVLAELDAVGVAAVIAKPCVRAMRSSNGA